MNKVWGVRAVRSSDSVWGVAESWCKRFKKVIEFPSEMAAQEDADDLNKKAYTPNVHYYPKELD